MNTTGPWVCQTQVLDIGPSRPVDEPTFTHGHMTPLAAVVEQVVRRAEPHSCIPIGELPPLVLEPNRRKVEPEEEVEEPTSPLTVTGQKLVKTIRSLSLKRGH